MTTITRPVARSLHAAAMGGDTLYICGGSDKKSFLHNDVWSFDLAAVDVGWRLLSAEGVSPMSRRIGHGAAYLRGVLYFSGGNDPARYGVPDLWSFDVRRSAWRQLSTWDVNSGLGPRAMYFPKLVARDEPVAGSSVARPAVYMTWGIPGDDAAGKKLSLLPTTRVWRFGAGRAGTNASTWAALNVSGEAPPEMWSPLVAQDSQVAAAGPDGLVGGLGWLQDDSVYADTSFLYRLDLTNGSKLSATWSKLKPPPVVSACKNSANWTDMFGQPCSSWARTSTITLCMCCACAVILCAQARF